MGMVDSTEHSGKLKKKLEILSEISEFLRKNYFYLLLSLNFRTGIKKNLKTLNTQL